MKKSTNWNQEAELRLLRTLLKAKKKYASTKVAAIKDKDLAPIADSTAEDENNHSKETDKKDDGNNPNTEMDTKTNENNDDTKNKRHRGASK